MRSVGFHPKLKSNLNKKLMIHVAFNCIRPKKRSLFPITRLSLKNPSQSKLFIVFSDQNVFFLFDFRPSLKIPSEFKLFIVIFTYFRVCKNHNFQFVNACSSCSRIMFPNAAPAMTAQVNKCRVGCIDRLKVLFDQL